MGKKDDSKNINEESKTEVQPETKQEEVIKEPIKTDEKNITEEKSKNSGLILKIVISFIILLVIIIGGKLIFSKFKDDDSITGVRKLLKTKYADITCINLDCDGFIAIDGDKLSKYKVILYNVDGKKVANYKVNYDSANKTTEVPIEIGDNYYLSTTVSVDKLKISKYSIRNKRGKVVYETENKLEILNDNFILMTEDKTSDDKYTLLNKKGKVVYKDLDDVDSYINGDYITISANDTYSILNSKGDKILDGYKISKIVTDEDDEPVFAIIRNAKEDIYNYYNLNKNKVIGDSFDSYTQNDDDLEFTITKKENDKRVKYTLFKDGKQEKIGVDNEDLEKDIKEKINNEVYTLYDDGISGEDQKYIFVDNKKDKSFGILNIENNKYTQIYSYKQDRKYFYSTISEIDSEDNSYFKITCSSYNCDSKRAIIYNLDENKELYKTEGELDISSYTQYDDGYKVIKFASFGNDKYSGKYVVFDKDNKELSVSKNSILIVDKELVAGRESKYSISLYSVKKNKILNKEVVSAMNVADEVLYKYNDDNNTIILNSKGEEIINVKKDDYLELSGESYIYIKNNIINIYNIEKDKTYKYKSKENEKLNSSSGYIIKPFRNAIFLNNSSDKYVKILNFKGNQIKKIKNVEISSVEINKNAKKAFIIVRKTSEKGNTYGLYVAE
ncbi:MAG: hypothetical protein J6J17_04275 [Bacilli bacterium]|nr:hypothetical protein [Bacilli bacterium]